MKEIENFDHLRLEKILTTSDVKEQLNSTAEDYRALEAIIRKFSEDLGELKSDVREVKQSTHHIDERVSQVLSNQEQSQQRELSMLKGQEKFKLMLKKLGENPTFLAVIATILADWVNDIVKELVKKTVGEERFEAGGEAIKALLEPLSSPALELIAPLPLLLKIATAVGILLAARFFLNHTGSLWQAIRSGLAKLRSLFASKK